MFILLYTVCVQLTFLSPLPHHAVPPVISGTPSNISSLIGVTITLNCTATSLPRHSVTWTLNGDLVLSSARRHIDMSLGPSYGALTLHNTTLSDAGTYTCTVANSYGNDTANFELLLQGMKQCSRYLQNRCYDKHF